jgi:hypothetical protein
MFPSNKSTVTVNPIVTSTVISLTGTAQSVVEPVVAHQHDAIMTELTLALGVTGMENFLRGHPNDVITVQHGNIMYVVESVADHGALTPRDSVIELVGVHTIAATTTGSIA